MKWLVAVCGVQGAGALNKEAHDDILVSVADMVGHDCHDLILGEVEPVLLESLDTSLAKQTENLLVHLRQLVIILGNDFLVSHSLKSREVRV